MSKEKALVDVLNLLTRPGAEAAPTRKAREVLRLRDVIGTKNIVGIGISEKVSNGKATGELALCFYVQKKIPLSRLRASDAIPASVHPAISSRSLLTDVVELGRLKPDAGSTGTHKKKSAKIQPGTSVGHYKMTAGTLGAIVTRNGSFELLSNSHVLALSGKAKIGDAILAPAKDDGGKKPADVVAKLSKVQKFKLGGAFVNKVDCASAAVLSDRIPRLDASIKSLGFAKGVGQAKRGMKIVKVGRTTNKTTGVVKDVHFRFVLPYQNVGDVGFTDQILCTRYSSFGDSGALVLEKGTKRAVGLHFASAPQGSVFCPLDAVLDSLGATLVTSAI